MAKQDIIVISEEEIIKKANALGGGRSWLITATEHPVENCDIKATVLNGKILNWSIYSGNDWGGMRYKTCKDAIKYLKSCEE